MEQLIEEGVFLCVSPQRNEGEVVLPRGILVPLEDDVVDVELMHVLEQLDIRWGVWVRELNY